MTHPKTSPESLQDRRRIAAAWVVVIDNYRLFPYLVGKYYPYLGQADRDEIASAAVLRVVERFGEYDPHRSKLSTWISMQVRAAGLAERRRSLSQGRSRVSVEKDLQKRSNDPEIAVGLHERGIKNWSISATQETTVYVVEICEMATDRQLEVIRGYLLGLERAEIAANLGISTSMCRRTIRQIRCRAQGLPESAAR